MANYFNKHLGLSPYVQVPEMFWLLVQAKISGSDTAEDEDLPELYNSEIGGD
jgi:hypothetical protein